MDKKQRLSKPEYKVQADFILDHAANNLSEWEINFMNSVIFDIMLDKGLTYRQAKSLRQIYYKIHNKE